MAKQFVSYLRVSTNRQGESGLGLEAQRAAVAGYIRSVGGELLGENVEVESGSAKHRPILLQSIARCKAARATLLIAKIDRLSRNVAFVSSLMESSVEFVAVDAPYANKLMIHILSAFAEHEREQISVRTKAALAAAKGRGVILGKHGKVLAEKNKAEAIEFAEAMRTHLEEVLQESGYNLTKVAALLNEKGVLTRDEGIWYPMSVKRVMDRLGIGFKATLETPDAPPPV